MRRSSGAATILAGVLGALGVAGLLASSCAVPGFELVDAPPGAGGGGNGTGGIISSGGGGSGGAGACNSIRPPSPPAQADPGPNDVDFVVAVYSMHFGEDFDPLTEIGPSVGYDLDKECTCIDEGPATCVPVGSNPNDCDGPRGRDNAVARVFNNLNLFFTDTFDSDYNSTRAQEGDWTLLLRVMDYNGQPNDDSVRVAIYPSPGRDNDPCLPSQTPNWDGSDVWPVDAFAIEGYTGSGGSGGSGGGSGGGAGCGAAGPGLPLDVNQPAFVSSAGYVTNSVLVADLPKTSLVLSASSNVTELKLVGGFVTARLEQQAEGWAMLDAVLTGRWKISDLFAMIGGLEDNNQAVCTDHPLYEPVKNILCNFPDITAEVSGAAAPCDALSFGMGFEARAAHLGFVLDSLQGGLSPCPVDTDPANDSCG